MKFRDGIVVPALGQGSAGLAQRRHPPAAEEEALRTGISLGMTVIDTSEGYGGGRSEELIGRAIAGQRDHVFLVQGRSSRYAFQVRWAAVCELPFLDPRGQIMLPVTPLQLVNFGQEILQHFPRLWPRASL